MDQVEAGAELPTPSPTTDNQLKLLKIGPHRTRTVRTINSIQREHVDLDGVFEQSDEDKDVTPANKVSGRDPLPDELSFEN